MLDKLLSRFHGHTIPQSEIDAEARRYIVEYGVDAVQRAGSAAQRAQWAKGNSDTQERALRVYGTVRAYVGKAR